MLGMKKATCAFSSDSRNQNERIYKERKYLDLLQLAALRGMKNYTGASFSGFFLAPPQTSPSGSSALECLENLTNYEFVHTEHAYMPSHKNLHLIQRTDILEMLYH